jgi:hypothetical protein
VIADETVTGGEVMSHKVALEITATDDQMEGGLTVLVSALRNIGSMAASAGFTVRLLADGEEIE